jgi:hypothetical protein
MTNAEGHHIHIHRWLSSDRVVFVVVSVTIIAVLVEAGIIRTTGFVGTRDLSLEIAIFVGLGILCTSSQLIILNFVRNKVEKSFLSHTHTYIGFINKAIIIVQVGIIALLIVVLLEVSLAHSYHKILITAVIMSSFLTASVLTALLSWRFIVWIKSNKNRLILVYLLATLFISASAIAGVVYFQDQLFYQPDIIYPKSYGDFLTHVEIGNSSFVYVYTISSAIAFVLLWTGTVFVTKLQKKNR